MEDPEGDTAMDFKGKKVMGVRIPVAELLTPADQAFLRQTGFPLSKEDAIANSPSRRD